MAARRKTSQPLPVLYIFIWHAWTLLFWISDNSSKKSRYGCLHVFHIIVNFGRCIKHHVIKYALCTCPRTTTNLVYLIGTRIRFIRKKWMKMLLDINENGQKQLCNFKRRFRSGMIRQRNLETAPSTGLKDLLYAESMLLLHRHTMAAT